MVLCLIAARSYIFGDEEDKFKLQSHGHSLFKEMNPSSNALVCNGKAADIYITTIVTLRQSVALRVSGNQFLTKSLLTSPSKQCLLLY